MTSSGIVLAGGASRRFGSDKLLEPIAGLTLLGRSVGALAGLVDEIIVVTAPGRPVPVLTSGAGATVRIVADAAAFGGPLVGVHTGLAAARGATVLVIGGDMPSLVPAVLLRILERSPAALGDADGILRPLPCSLERGTAVAAAGSLLDRGERRLRALLSRLGVSALPWPEWQDLDPGGLTLADIDDRSDLAGMSETPVVRPGSRGRRGPVP